MPKLSEVIHDEGHLTALMRSAREAREKQMHIVDELVSGYHTPFYCSNDATAAVKYDPENYAYQRVSREVAQIIMRNPRFLFDAERGGVAEAIAVQHKYLVNHRVEETDLYETLWQCGHDFYFARSIVLVEVEEDTNYPLKDEQGRETGEYAMNPVAYRVSPHDFIEDPRAVVPRDHRFRGHEWNTTKEELLARAEEENDDEEEYGGGWDLAAIKSLPDDKLIDDDRLEPSPTRDEARVLELWFPRIIVDEDALPEKGFHGTTLSCAMLSGGGLKIIRKARPWLGPDFGPYIFTGASYVQDNLWPLAPLVAGYGQVSDLNKLTRRFIANAMRHKKMVGVAGGDNNLIEAVKKGADAGVFPLRSIDDVSKIAQIETGGNSDQDFKLLQDAQLRADRNNMTSDTDRGMASRGRTATADALADQSRDVRTESHKTRFHGCLIQPIGKAFSWHYFHNERARGRIPRSALEEMSEDALRAIGLDPQKLPEGEITYAGGDDKQFPDTPWSTLGISVEPYSAEYVTPGLMQKRLLDGLAIVPVLHQIKAMGGDARGLANMAGAALNIHNFAKIAGVDGPTAVAMPAMPGMETEQVSGSLPGNEMGAELARAYGQ